MSPLSFVIIMVPFAVCTSVKMSSFEFWASEYKPCFPHEGGFLGVGAFGLGSERWFGNSNDIEKLLQHMRFLINVRWLTKKWSLRASTNAVLCANNFWYVSARYETHPTSDYSFGTNMYVALTHFFIFRARVVQILMCDSRKRRSSHLPGLPPAFCIPHRGLGRTPLRGQEWDPKDSREKHWCDCYYRVFRGLNFRYTGRVASINMHIRAILFFPAHFAQNTSDGVLIVRHL